MNILIIGLGSVGQRHLRNIRLVLKNKKFQIYALRRKFFTPLLSNKNIPINGNIEKKFNIELDHNLPILIKSKGKYNNIEFNIMKNTFGNKISEILENKFDDIYIFTIVIFYISI